MTSVDQLLKDRRLFSIAMKAHGLEDMTYATAFMRKVLESDLNDTSSFARKLADPPVYRVGEVLQISPPRGP